MLKSLIIPLTLNSNLGKAFALCLSKIFKRSPFDGSILKLLPLDSSLAALFDVLIKFSTSATTSSRSSSD